MRIEIVSEKDDEDGYVILEVRLDDEMWRLLVQLGFEKLLDMVIKDAKEDERVGRKV